MKRPRILLHGILSVSVLAAIASSQTSAKIEGIVEDPFGSAIAGARVTAKLVRGPGAPRQVTTVSDNTGKYTLIATPGTYNISASADGYVAPAIGDRRPGIVLLTVDSGTGNREVHRVDLLLYRTSIIRGKLVDKASKQAVVRQTVRMWVARHTQGQLTLVPTADPSTTDSEGGFVIEDVPPGDYFLEIQPSSKESIVAENAGHQTRTRHRGYRRTYWPEGETPVRVEAGADLNVGKLEVAGGPFYRIWGAVEFGSCSDGDRFLLSLAQRYGTLNIDRAHKSMPCNSPLLIENIGPGDYLLEAWIQRRSLLQREYAGVAVVISDEDFKVTAQAERPYRISGHMTLPDGFPNDLSAALEAVLLPVQRMPFAEEAIPVAVGKDGDFNLAAFQRGESELEIQGLRPPYYVESVSYNGSRLPGTVLTLNPYAMTHHVEVKISDKPATVEGAVAIGDQHAPGVRVLIGKWPLVFKGGYPVFSSSLTDDKGHFRKSGLAPGTYRVLAVSESAFPRLQRREEAAQALSIGKEVELSEGTQSVALEVSLW